MVDSQLAGLSWKNLSMVHSFFILIHSPFLFFVGLTHAYSQDSIKVPKQWVEALCGLDYKIVHPCCYHIALAQSCHRPNSRDEELHHWWKLRRERWRSAVIFTTNFLNSRTLLVKKRKTEHGKCSYKWQMSFLSLFLFLFFGQSKSYGQVRCQHG